MPAKRRSSLRAALTGAIVDLLGLTADKPPPTEFRIFAKGVNASTKGEFLFDDVAAASVMAAAAQHGVDFTIDYDHHTLHTANGVKAVSAGWFSLGLRDGELWAENVKWTPPAVEHLAKREYRYFSPFFDYDPKTGRPTELINNALTNTPALHGLDALVAASATEDDDMDPKLKEALDRQAELERQVATLQTELAAGKNQTATAALSVSIGLATTATPDEIRGKVTALVSFRKDVLALAGKESEAAAMGALTAMKDQAAEATVLRGKVEAAETAALQTEYDGVMTTAIKAGIIPPAKEHPRHKFALSCSGAGAGKLTKDGLVQLKTYVETLDVAPGQGGSGEGAKPPVTNVALSDAEREIARRSGSSIEQLTKYKERRLGGGA